MLNEAASPATDSDGAPSQTNTSPTLSVDIDTILAERQAFVGHIEEAASALRKAGTTLEVRTTGRRGNVHFPSDRGVAAVIQAYDAARWSELLDKSGLRSFLDATAREAWRKHLDEGTHPELNAENVRSTFAMLFEQRGEMFERGVAALFQRLGSWHYKTNSPVKFGKRLVIENAAQNGYAGTRFCDSIDDLIRVMSVVDGKPEPDHRQGTWAALKGDAEGRWWPRDRNNVVLQGLISVRGFKNGNCHLTFLRMDLVDALNRIVARLFPNALPPSET